MSKIAARPLPEQLETEEQSVLAHAEPVNILVVDDLPEKLLVYESILEELGQNMITASSGEEALKLILKHEFAVILLDVNMPGIDGFETASLIRKRKKSARTPIIFLTAFLDEMYAAQGYASGAVDYLQTPVVPKILRAKVQVFIELFQMRRQAALQAEEYAKRTAAEESAQRWAFLGEIGNKLAKIKNQREILRVVVETTVPYLAELSLLRLSGREGIPDSIEWHGILPENYEQPPAFPWLEKTIRDVMKTGHYQLVYATDLIPTTKTSSHRSGSDSSQIFGQIFSSILVLPVIISGETRGVLVLFRHAGKGAYPAPLVYLSKQLAARVSVALENAMLIEHIQEGDRRKDEFLGMLAHELRNPLAPISNVAQLMRMMDLKESRLIQGRDILERQVKHMSRLIDDLLDATRLARGKVLLRYQSCDLTTIVRQTAEDYRSIFESRQLKLLIDVPPEPLFVKGDPTRLIQTIGNLLHNAHKFTDTGGEITVSLKQDKAGNKVRICVRDSGIGIDPAMLPYVFDVFRQAEQGLDRTRGGLGLGLALVQGLVKLHGGQVSATSKGLGKGAEFALELPLEPSFQETTEAEKPATEHPLGKYRVLIIEDNRDTAESSSLLLRMEGHEVKTAYNGTTGLEIAYNFHPEILLCDIGLPEMDGYQIARLLRADPRLSSVYAIALTGYGREDDQQRARQAGFNVHLTKPIDPVSLHQALSQYNEQKFSASGSA